jgi:hypothetical protein
VCGECGSVRVLWVRGGVCVVSEVMINYYKEGRTL